MNNQEPHSQSRGVVIVALVTVIAAITAAVVVLLTPSSTPLATQATPPQTTGHRSPAVRGELTAVAGDTVTVTPDRGAAIVVDLSSTTRFGTARHPEQRAAFTIGTQVGVIGTSHDGRIEADRIVRVATTKHPSPAPASTAPPTTAPPTTAPPTTAPPTTVSTPPGSAGPDSTAVRADLASAVAYASGQGEQSAAVVLDTHDGAYYAAGAADSPFNTASVVKVFIATDLLLTGQMNGSTATTAYAMITQSDDDAADALYGLTPGDQVVTTIATHYGIPDLGSPPADAGQWGETKITADGLAHLYAALQRDPTVWPWLSNAMSNATRSAADGTDQFFGIPSASNDWTIKQGWMVGLGPGATYNSTGYVADDRYVVVLLTSGAANRYGTAMADTISTMARDVLPDGRPAITAAN